MTAENIRLFGGTRYIMFCYYNIMNEITFQNAPTLPLFFPCGQYISAIIRIIGFELINLHAQVEPESLLVRRFCPTDPLGCARMPTGPAAEQTTERGWHQRRTTRS
ncbi:unnamed protein product [Ixodes pacificus]